LARPVSSDGISNATNTNIAMRKLLAGFIFQLRMRFVC
jgi:hypothetical protein